MNHQVLVGVLDGRANGTEKLEASGHRQLVPVTVLVQGKALDIFHHEVGLARVSGAAIE